MSDAINRSERIKQVLAGEFRAAARLMRDIDDRTPEATAQLKELFPHTGRAYVVGITGNPGAGKSTVVDGLIEIVRKQGKKVGVVAVDPSSPFSGGAILGDRIRMQRHALDPGVFIRSLATRGQMGGLSRSTFDIVNVLDAMGMDVVLVETVGVGQDEIDIMRIANTTAVVTVPGLGDDVQAIKAGILEIADVLAVNKADREGADRAVRDLLHMLELRASDGERKEVEIVKTIASLGSNEKSGLAEMWRALLDAWARLTPEARERRSQARARYWLQELVRTELMARAEALVAARGSLDELASQIAARKTDPYSEAERIVAGM